MTDIQIAILLSVALPLFLGMLLLFAIQLYKMWREAFRTNDIDAICILLFVTGAYLFLLLFVSIIAYNEFL